MVHAVGDGTFIVDGPKIDRRKMMASKIPFGVFGIDIADAGEAFSASNTTPLVKKSKADKISPVFAKTAEKKITAKSKPQTKTAPAVSKKSKKTTAEIVFPEPLTGDAIYAWRSSLGDTRSAFAERIQITAASVSNWEKKGAATIGVQARTMSVLRLIWKQTHP